MTSDQWKHIKGILEACLDAPPEQRLILLDTLCEGDAACRKEVVRLLQASENPTPFLEDTVWAESTEAIEELAAWYWIGKRIGAYKVIRKLGQGGMGTVFLAERADGMFDQKVAIKLVEKAVYRADLVKRFAEERRILATLQHANIARLLDGGVTETGIPFLVMEYIEGRTLLDHCDTNKLSLRQRLALFRTMCDAVHYAHQNLVIHRDLKPSNVLVSEANQKAASGGVIKLLDFGVAKLLGAAVEEASEETRDAGHPMTVAYASPEQIQNHAVTTSSDVYSLGVILYELLTGERPYDVTGLSAAGVENVILKGNAKRPSETFRISDSRYSEQVASRAEMRQDTPDGLRRAVQGDLDTIVLKALSKDATMRYVSVFQLSDDVQRYLDHLPVIARPVSIKYRTAKFIQRHRIGVGISFLMFVFLLASVAVTTHQARVAERNASQIRRLANSLLFEMNDKVRDLPGATDVRRTLVAHALTYLENLSQETGPDPALQLELAEAYEQAGRIQGDPHYTNLGDLLGARKSYQKALSLRSSVWESDSSEASHRIGLANNYGRLAVTTSWCCDNREAMTLTMRGIQLLVPLLEEDPEDIGIRHDMARMQSEMGWWMIWDGQTQEGLDWLTEATSELEYVSTNLPKLLDAQHHVWRAYSYQVDGLKFSGRNREALQLLEEKALPLLTSALYRNPKHPLLLYDLHVTYLFLGDMQAQGGMPEQSLSSFSHSLEIAEELAASDSTNRKALEALAYGNTALGKALARTGESEASFEHMSAAVEIRRRLYHFDPLNAEMGNALGNAARALCRELLDLGRAGEAVTYCEEASDVLYEIVASAPRGPIVAANYASSCAFSARAFKALFELETQPGEREQLRNEALLWYKRALAVLDKLESGKEDLVWEVPLAEVVSEMAELSL